MISKNSLTLSWTPGSQFEPRNENEVNNISTAVASLTHYDDGRNITNHQPEDMEWDEAVTFVPTSLPEHVVKAAHPPKESGLPGTNRKKLLMAQFIYENPNIDFQGNNSDSVLRDDQDANPNEEATEHQEGTTDAQESNSADDPDMPHLEEQAESLHIQISQPVIVKHADKTADNLDRSGVCWNKTTKDISPIPVADTRYRQVQSVAPYVNTIPEYGTPQMLSPSIGSVANRQRDLYPSLQCEGSTVISDNRAFQPTDLPASLTTNNPPNASSYMPSTKILKYPPGLNQNEAKVGKPLTSSRFSANKTIAGPVLEQNTTSNTVAGSTLPEFSGNNNEWISSFYQQYAYFSQTCNQFSAIADKSAASIGFDALVKAPCMEEHAQTIINNCKLTPATSCYQSLGQQVYGDSAVSWHPLTGYDRSTQRPPGLERPRRVPNRSPNAPNAHLSLAVGSPLKFEPQK